MDFNFNFLHNSQCIIFPTQLCLVSYYNCASLLHSLILWLIFSSLSPPNLHLLFQHCCGLDGLDSSSDLQFFQSSFQALESAPTIIGITVNLMFHSFFSSSTRSKNLFIFPLSLSFTLIHRNAKLPSRLGWGYRIHRLLLSSFSFALSILFQNKIFFEAIL